MVILLKIYKGEDFIMDKILEKKNLGIPVTLLVLIAYFIGYNVTGNLYGLFVAVAFGGAVFALNFDERVKIAVKQSYTIAFLLSIIYFFVEILSHLNYMLSSVTANYNYQPSTLYNIFNKLYATVNSVFHIGVIIIFAILIIITLTKKDIKINFILNILGEGTPKQPQPIYQQNQAFQQPIPPMAPQPMQGVTCPKCQALNKLGATFCGTCGNKLQ